MPVDIGDLYPITVETRAAPDIDGEDGDLTDTTSVTVTVTNLTTGVAGAPIALSRASLGRYVYDYPCTLGGLFEWEAVAAGTIEGTFGDVFVVEAASASSTAFVSGEETLRRMRALGVISGPVDLDQVRWLTLVACESVERDLGRLFGRHTITDSFDGDGRRELKLRKVPPRPVDGGQVSVTSLTENGIPLVEGSGYVVRRNGWNLVRGSSLSAGCWQYGIENVQATYVTTCEPIPKVARQVAVNTAARLWQSTQQTPMPYSDDISSEQALGAVVAGLTAYDLTAYRSLGRVPVA